MNMVGGISRESARYKIGPLTAYVEPQVLKQWHLDASPGEDLVYAIGPGLGKSALTPKIARELASKGEATLLQRREGGGTHYIIRKHELRTDGPSAAPTQAWEGKPEGRLLTAVSELADIGLPLPLYDELAEVCGLAGGEAVRYRLNVLARAGAVRLFGPVGARVVEVCSTGRRTAPRGAGR